MCFLLVLLLFIQIVFGYLYRPSCLGRIGFCIRNCLFDGSNENQERNYNRIGSRCCISNSWACMSRKTFYWINILVPLLFGVIVYLYWKPDAYISRLILHYLPISYESDLGRPEGICKFIRYYFSDICWAYALTFSRRHSSSYGRFSPLVARTSYPHRTVRQRSSYRP